MSSSILRLPRLAAVSLAAVSLAVVLPTAGEVRAAGPSFDCAGARGEVETAICRSSAISALDTRIAVVYRRLMAAWKDDAESRGVLRDVQRAFLDRREDALRSHDEGLESLHDAQLALLEAIDTTPRRGFDGIWGGLQGSFQIREEPQGLAFWGATVEPVRFRWICEIDTLGRIDGATFVAPSEAGPPNFPEWSLQIERLGAAVRLREIGPPGTTVLPDGSNGDQRPHCGNNGRFDGVFLPLRGKPTR